MFQFTVHFVVRVKVFGLLKVLNRFHVPIIESGRLIAKAIIAKILLELCDPVTSEKEAVHAIGFRNSKLIPIDIERFERLTYKPFCGNRSAFVYESEGVS